MTDESGTGPRPSTKAHDWTIETVKVDALIPYWIAKVIGTPNVCQKRVSLESQPTFSSIFKERALDQAKDWIDEQAGAGKYAPNQKPKPENVVHYDPFSFSPEPAGRTGGPVEGECQAHGPHCPGTYVDCEIPISPRCTHENLACEVCGERFC